MTFYPLGKRKNDVKKLRSAYKGTPERLSGLVVMYPQVISLSSVAREAYYNKMMSDNADIISVFDNSGYRTLWLPHREAGSRSSHLEIWPLAHAKKRLMVLYVNCKPINRGYHERFVSHVAKSFRQRHDNLISLLEKQEFTFDTHPTHEPTRIVLY